jgi:hypothetical protein
LEREINQNERPVILGMHKGSSTHWVLVIDGSGSQTSNYIIHDPWPIHGAKMKLSAYNNWYLDRLVVYDGDPDCGNMALMAAELVSFNVNTQLPISDTAESTEERDPLTVEEARALDASSVVTGSAWLYRMTAQTMTVQLIAESDDSYVTEMLLWTDEMTETTWQPFSTFAVLPRGEEIYVRFRDDAENTSAEAAETSHPPASPETAPFEVYLPAVLKY